MEGHVVTTSPWLVMAINMFVVFVVLIALGILMKIIYWVDPTRKKSEPAPVSTPAPVAPVVPEPSSIPTTNNEEVVAAIVGAIVSMGYSSEQIASIRPTSTSKKWRLEGRLSGRN